MDTLDQIDQLHRFEEVPHEGPMCDLLWSDPDDDCSGWGDVPKGVSYTFGPSVVGKFLSHTGLDLICRAHQVVEEGYLFMFNRRLVTVFSAPDYCGEFDNAGAVMCVDEDLLCSFVVIPSKSKTEALLKRKLL